MITPVVGNAAVAIIVGLCGTTPPPPEYPASAPVVQGVYGKVAFYIHKNGLMTAKAKCNSGQDITAQLHHNKATGKVSLVGVNEQTASQLKSAKDNMDKWIKRKIYSF